MGLEGTEGEEVVGSFPEVLAGGEGDGGTLSVRRKASTRSWKGSGWLMLVSVSIGPVFCYSTEGSETEYHR